MGPGCHIKVNARTQADVINTRAFMVHYAIFLVGSNIGMHAPTAINPTAKYLFADKSFTLYT